MFFFLQQYASDPVLIVVILLAIGLAIGVHEAAHAWTADKLGDPTARLLGRTSINPLVHLDLIGTLMFVILGFGWGKPVPIDERNLKTKTNVVLVALAGPASNLITALILGTIMRFVTNDSLLTVLGLFVLINLSLMVFNLIPIPPLDGSRVLRLFVPDQIYNWFERNSLYIVLILFFLISFGFGDWIGTIVGYIFRLITGLPF